MDTGTLFGTAFHTADDVDEVAGYRSVSALAIVSFVVGLLSSLCLLAPVLWFIPVFGVVLSLVAIGRIASNDGVMGGRGLALAGLALCVACGVSMVGHRVVTRYLRVEQAEAFAREWLAVLAAGKIEPAFRSTMEGTRPPMIPDPGEPAPTTTPYDVFKDDEIVQQVASIGPEVEIKLLGTQEYTPQTRTQFLVRQLYAVSSEAVSKSGDSPKSIEVILDLQRTRFTGQSRPRWLVASIKRADVATDAAFWQQDETADHEH